METLKKLQKNSLNKKEYDGLENVLGIIFDELMFDFKIKFIEKISILINEVRHSDSILEIDKGEHNVKRRKHNNHDKNEDEDEKKKNNKYLYNEGNTLSIYLESYMDRKNHSLLKKLKRGSKEREIYGSHKNIDFEDDDNKVEEDDEEEDDKKKHSLNLFEGGKKNFNFSSKIENDIYKIKDKSSIILNKDTQIKSDIDNNEINLLNLKKAYEYNYFKKKNMSENIKELAISNELNKNISDLQVQADPSQKKDLDVYSNVISRYTVKRLLSNRGVDKYGSNNNKNACTNKELISSSYIDKLMVGKIERLGYSSDSNDENLIKKPKGSIVDDDKKYNKEKETRWREKYLGKLRGKYDELLSKSLEELPEKGKDESNDWKFKFVDTMKTDTAIYKPRYCNLKDKLSIENINYKNIEKEYDAICKKREKHKVESLASEKDPINYLIEAELRERMNTHSNDDDDDKCVKNNCKKTKGSHCENKKKKQLFFEVIRGKRRKNLKGFECDDCKSFYNEIFSDHSENENFKQTEENVNRFEKKKKYIDDDSKSDGQRNPVHDILKKKLNQDINTKSGDILLYKNNKYNYDKENNTTISGTLKKIYQKNNIIYSKNRKNDSNSMYDSDIDKSTNDGRLSSKYEQNGKEHINRSKQDDVNEDTFYEICDDNQNKKKETNKKKAIQAYSRHRFHNKVNDSPQNFWSFDFFK
ncbi:conserved Plasmodium protein, unknown function [Plasmodium vinckei]|uniref:DNA endonuclease activator Ctp1 C-terminal domain-containing protein n=1 Tax=Plasmodium vinckei TaxID=5860 RepID=A0A6V7TFE0_PLAVN|nr:conserved Plasmodium protein, unknown function [Plasmodium vinckei]